MKWVTADSLYCAEQYPFSHLDAYGHYIAEAGEEVTRLCWTHRRPGPGWWIDADADMPLAVPVDVVFVLDRYDAGAKIPARVHIAQVAALCNPMPWDVRKKDGSPAYSLVISSIPAMVERARAAGCRAEYQPLAFDLRARACMMGVKREHKCIFIGTTGPNHRRRTELLRELSDVVEVLPPVYGREYFRALAGATAVLNIHADWSDGVANNMRLFESAGMGCMVISDGVRPDVPGWPRPFHLLSTAAAEIRAWANIAAGRVGKWDRWVEYDGDSSTGEVLLRHTYESRIPQLISWATDLMESR